MLRHLFICLLLFVLSDEIHSQNHDYYWVMGYGSHPSTAVVGGTDIDFNVSPPDTSYVFRDMNMVTSGNSVCDTYGNLLFYTNGCYLASSDNEPLLNGWDLNPGWAADEYCGHGYPAPQATLFLPFPSDTNLYYLFHLGVGWVDGIGGVGEKFYQTIIDKSLDNGRGDVIVKNEIILEDTLAWGKLTATKHANGRDWWLIVPEMMTNKHYTFLFSPDGISPPFGQKIGEITFDDDGTGQAVFSPDGTIYAHYDKYNNLNLFDFDRCTGILSNPRHIIIPFTPDSTTLAGGVTMSPNSRYMYVTTSLKVFQFDLWANSIDSSRKTVAIYDGYASPFGSYFYLPQLAPNGKIFINCPNGENVMHVINEPNMPGLSCNLTQHSFALPTFNGSTIPNLPNYRLGPIDGGPCDTLGMDNIPLANFRFDLDTADLLKVEFTDNSWYEPETWHWNFGDGTQSEEIDPVHSFPQQAVYEVCLTVSNPYGSDTECREVDLSVNSDKYVPQRQQYALVYPNPAIDKFTLKLPGPLQKKAALRLFNAMGQLVKVYAIPAGFEEYRFPLQDVPSALYFYSLSADEEIITSGKLIKE